MKAQLKGELAKRFEDQYEVLDVFDGVSQDGKYVYREVFVRSSGRTSGGNSLVEQLAFDRRLAAMMRCFGTGMIFGMALLLIVQVALSHDLKTSSKANGCSTTVHY